MKRRLRPSSQLFRDKDESNSEKRRKINNGEHNLMDRISALPYEIIVSILSLLPLKEAAATSILSSQWRYVWASTLTLNFDSSFNFKVGDSFLELEEELKHQESCRYVSWVNRVVEQHKGANIEQFRACFFLDRRFANSIHQWIHFAMKKRVQILDLDFHVEYSVNPDSNYAFPRIPFRLLRSRRSSLEHSCGYNMGFKSLKVLKLRNVDVTGQVLESLLSNCPVLERLLVIGAKNLVNLRVVGSSIALKHLVIDRCHYLKSIEICDANIVSFIYCGFVMINLLLSNVPLLIDVSIYKRRFYEDCLSIAVGQISSCRSHIEILKLDIMGAVYTRNLVFPIFANLKHLELIVFADDHWALHLLNSFVKACPYMQRLVLKLEMHISSMEIGEIEEAEQCRHDYIKVVEIQGYRAHTCAVEHVMYLIKNVVALEKIVIDPVQHWRWGTGMGKPIGEVHAEVKARDHAMQYLKQKLPSTIDFVCL